MCLRLCIHRYFYGCVTILSILRLYKARVGFLVCFRSLREMDDGSLAAPGHWASRMKNRHDRASTQVCILRSDDRHFVKPFHYWSTRSPVVIAWNSPLIISIEKRSSDSENRVRDRERDRERERERDRQTDRDRDREREGKETRSVQYKDNGL